MTISRDRKINQRAREIRYGDGCGADEAVRRATEEVEQDEREASADFRSNARRELKLTESDR